MLADAIGGERRLAQNRIFVLEKRENLDRRGRFRLTKGGALGRSLERLKVPTRGIYLLDERTDEHIH
jgi:hypothetical protein